MFQTKFEDFTLAQFLPASVPSTGIAQCLAFDPRHLPKAVTCSPEAVGDTLLGVSDLCAANNYLLEAPQIRFPKIPNGAEGMLKRIEWMINARMCASDQDVAYRARQAVDLVVDQLSWIIDDVDNLQQDTWISGYPALQIDPEPLAHNLGELASRNPDLLAALFRGDLESVPTIIDASYGNSSTLPLVQISASMFLIWGLFELQKEACLGWRLKHQPDDGRWGMMPSKPYTIGQLFRPRLDQFDLAEEFAGHFSKCSEMDVDGIADRRITTRLERKLRSHGYEHLCKTDQNTLFAALGRPSNQQLSDMIVEARERARDYRDYFCARMSDTTGRSVAGKHADMLRARVSVVHRLAIVSARVYNISSLASRAKTTDDLRAMLEAHLPTVLKLCAVKKPNPHKDRLRQLFHVYRAEFLKDGEHLQKKRKARMSLTPMLQFSNLDAADKVEGCLKMPSRSFTTNQTTGVSSLHSAGSVTVKRR